MPRVWASAISPPHPKPCARPPRIRCASRRNAVSRPLPFLRSGLAFPVSRWTNARRLCLARRRSTLEAKPRLKQFTLSFSTTARAISSSAFGTSFRGSLRPEPPARDASRFSFGRAHSPVWAHHLRRIHARMPVPSPSRLLQSARIQAFYRLLHKRRYAPDLRPTACAPVRGDVGTTRSPARISISGGRRGHGSAGRSHSQLHAVPPAGVLPSPSLCSCRTISGAPRAAHFAAGSLRGIRTLPALRGTSRENPGWLRLFERIAGRLSCSSRHSGRRKAARNLRRCSKQSLRRTTPESFHVRHF